MASVGADIGWMLFGLQSQVVGDALCFFLTPGDTGIM